MSQLEQFRQTYREEATELLAELEEATLELEGNLGDEELIGRVFRALHTLKGSGAMFGFDAIAAFTHEVETTFDKVRDGELEATPELVRVTLEARDLIRAMLDAPVEGTPELAAAGQAIIARLGGAGSGVPAAAAQPAAVGGDDGEVTWRIRFTPPPEILHNGTKPIALLREVAELGRCHVVAHTSQIPRLSELDPELCSTRWDILLTTDQGEDAIRGVFLFVDEPGTLSVTRLEVGLEPEDDQRLGEILVARGDLSAEQLAEALGQQKKIGAVLSDAGVVSGDAVASALAEQKEVRKAREAKSASANASSIRVAADKLDALVDLVGELVIAQARLSQISASNPVDGLEDLAEEIERITGELRDRTLSVRMLPIGTTFGRFRRLVHDLSDELGKDIALRTEGAETELDKTVIERLGDPLVHIIRNSIDHGIEAPEVRVAAGKPERGTISLVAYHSGPNVFIEVHDDGRGLDAEAIRAKAIERGLVAADQKLSDKELFGLIFHAGFSTAKAVTSVSGRGVGMDVVRRAMEALRGAVEVESEHGVGTVVRVKLPLTLAIIEGLLVSVADDRFVLPLSLVEECIEFTGRDAAYARGQRLVPVRGEQVPYVRLRDWFAVDGAHPIREQVVVANIDGQRFGFAVDGVIGQHQTVIKSLGKVYRDIEGVSGATILGDGNVALILDVPRLVESIASASRRAAGASTATRKGA